MFAFYSLSISRPRFGCNSLSCDISSDFSPKRAMLIDQNSQSSSGCSFSRLILSVMGDDFTEAVKRVLAARVANRCSDPGCRALTSGPQDDPAKAVNVGVAAHITAASPGGPRYDPELLPEERCGPGNGIWLCQNHAKLVDNDPARFSVELLRKWKADAEAEARDRVGKTAVSPGGPAIQIEPGARVRIAPIVPRVHEQSDFGLLEDKGKYLIFAKFDSQRVIDIPRTFIEKVHSVGDSKPAIVELSGRIQWVSANGRFELFPEKPPSGAAGAYGIGKNVDFGYAARLGIGGSFAREERLPLLLTQGWYVYYDLDGTYLRWPGPDVDQILVYNWV